MTELKLDQVISRESGELHSTKRCPHCGEIKDTKEFYHSGFRKDGLSIQCKSCNQKYFKEYNIRCKDKIAVYHKKWLLRTKMQVLTYYGNGKAACVACGESDLRCLSIDHINSRGGNHRKEINRLGGGRFYIWLVHNNYPLGFRTLCMNCQFKRED